MTSAGTAFMQPPFAAFVADSDAASAWSLSATSTSSTSSTTASTAGSWWSAVSSGALPRLGGARGPVLVAIEGPAGSGKTTLAHALAHSLAVDYGLDVVVEAGVAVDDDARRPSSPRLRALAPDADRKARRCLQALNRVELLDALCANLHREGPRGAPDLILLDGYTLTGLVEAQRDDCVRAVRRVQEAFCVPPALTLLLRVSPLALCARRPLPPPVLTEVLHETQHYDAAARAQRLQDATLPGAVGPIQLVNASRTPREVCAFARRILVQLLREDGMLRVPCPAT